MSKASILLKGHQSFISGTQLESVNFLASKSRNDRGFLLLSKEGDRPLRNLRNLAQTSENTSTTQTRRQDATAAEASSQFLWTQLLANLLGPGLTWSKIGRSFWSKGRLVVFLSSFSFFFGPSCLFFTGASVFAKRAHGAGCGGPAPWAPCH